MRLLTENEVTFELSISDEDTSPRGNVDSGDAEADKALEDEILSRLDRGDLWAWCIVEVKAIWTSPSGKRYMGNDYLGGCSYRDEKNFTTEDGYYPDMKKAALADLNEFLANEVKAAEEIKTAIAEPPICAAEENALPRCDEDHISRKVACEYCATRAAPPHKQPSCDMVADCKAPIAYLDKKGFVYCESHGKQRQASQPCRKLRPHELKKIARGEQITRY